MFRDVCTFNDIQFGRLTISKENPLVLRMRDDYDFQDYFRRHSSVYAKKKKKIKSHYLPESVTDKEDNFIIILLPNSFINNI